MALFGSFGDALSGLKTKAFEATAKAFINQRIQKFGSVTSLTIDRDRKIISAQVELKGEEAPVNIEAGPFEIIRETEAGSIRFAAFQTSREWITAALNEFLAGRSFPLSEPVHRALASL